MIKPFCSCIHYNRRDCSRGAFLYYKQREGGKFFFITNTHKTKSNFIPFPLPYLSYCHPLSPSTARALATITLLLLSSLPYSSTTTGSSELMSNELRPNTTSATPFYLFFPFSVVSLDMVIGELRPNHPHTNNDMDKLLSSLSSFTISLTKQLDLAKFATSSTFLQRKPLKQLQCRHYLFYFKC